MVTKDVKIKNCQLRPRFKIMKKTTIKKNKKSKGTSCYSKQQSVRGHDMCE